MRSSTPTCGSGCGYISWDQSELRFEVPMLGSEVMVQRFGRAGQDAIFALEFLDPDAMSATDEVAHNPRRQRCPLCTVCQTARPPAGLARPRTTRFNGSSPLRPPLTGSFAWSDAPGAASATRLRNGCGSAPVRTPRSSPPVTFRRMTVAGPTEKPQCATDAESSSSEERNSPASRANASTTSQGFRVPTSGRMLRSS